MSARSLLLLVTAAFFLALARPAAAEEGRLLRTPDIHGDQVVFVYAGDLWTVNRAGGEAMRLTVHDGLERLPKFSPDGQWIAFTGVYDGNPDVYVMPATGGEPRRLTFHPGNDEVVEWSPDGKEVYFRSRRLSPTYRYNRMFHVPVTGGFPEVFPLPICERITFSPRGTDLVAYTELNREYRTWKRYKGGTAEEIWLYDFKAGKSERITDWEGTDQFPMWHGDVIYFNSDRDREKLNLHAYDTKTKTVTPLTDFSEYDVKWPSLGGDAIVFENGGWLYVVDLPGGTPVKIDVQIHTDAIHARPAVTNVARQIQGSSISPSAKRVVFAARGELFTVPAEKGDVRQLTATPGVFERYPAWSPDGKWVAYFADATGEYELYVKAQDGSGEPRQVTRGGHSFRYQPVWSPDSKQILFADQTWSLFLADVESGKVTLVDKSEVTDIEGYVWSPDSRWVAYAKSDENDYPAVWVYSVKGAKKERVTGSLYPDYSPSFDPEGKYLYFLSDRHFNPTFNAYAFEYVLQDATGIYALALTKDTPQPFPPESDEEEPAKDDDQKDDKKAKSEKKGKDEKRDAEKEDAAEVTVEIDFDGLMGRVSEFPMSPGGLVHLTAAKGKLFFLETGAFEDDDDEGPGGRNVLKFFDTEEREVKTALAGINNYELTPDGTKVLYAAGPRYGIADAAEDQSMSDGKLDTGGLEAMVDPRAEWAEMFRDAWRLERDFFYDPDMHGLDWDAMYERYQPLIPHVRHRDDLNYVIGELIGELSTSHAYVGGGDYPDVPRVGVGLLGAVYAPDSRSGLYRFASIYRDSDWDGDVIAPLAQPGIEVKEGDYLLEVNGRPVTTAENIYAAFQNTAGKQITILVNDQPGAKGAREYTVEPVGDEYPLAYETWVEGNRRRVYEASDGRLAYIHMPDTAIDGVKRFSRDFYAQSDKSGLILDGRYNSGGFIPDYVIDRLNRVFLGLWSRREGRDFRTPGAIIQGPKVCVTNAWAGSGGDAIPYFFREAKLGPVVGTRTWGGLVGISHGIRLMDGGRVTMPNFGFWIPGKGWQVENHGVDPDYEVLNLPEKVMAGGDPQLEKAIELALEELKKAPAAPKRPQYPVKRP
jgi:tricorn protease